MNLETEPPLPIEEPTPTEAPAEDDEDLGEAGDPQ